MDGKNQEVLNIFQAWMNVHTVSWLSYHDERLANGAFSKEKKYLLQLDNEILSEFVIVSAQIYINVGVFQWELNIYADLKKSHKTINTTKAWLCDDLYNTVSSCQLLYHIQYH